jgi:hypothetical protein
LPALTEGLENVGETFGPPMWPGQETGPQRESAAPAPSRLADLQVRVQQATAQVVVQAQHIEALTAENAQLRQEIASLQRLLSAKPVGQPA